MNISDIMRKPVDERLIIYRGLIAGSLANENVPAKMTRFGYDQIEIERGNGLNEDAYDKQQIFKREYGEKYGATDDFHAARDAAVAFYMDLIFLARRALRKDREWLNQLDLVGDRDRDYELSVSQMEHFYETALLMDNTEIRAKLAKRGVAD